MTATERRMLELIEAHVSEYSYPPTIRELMEMMSIASPSTIHKALKALEADGYIKRRLHSPRAIQVLDRNLA